MPEVNGLAAARLLHEIFCERACPRLIAVTAVAEKVRQYQESEGLAFDAVVSKQIGLPALLTVIATHLASVAEARLAIADGNQATIATANVRDREARVAGSASNISGGGRLVTGAKRGISPVDDAPALLDNPFAPPPYSDGQVQAISLGAFKAALGPEWPRVALRAMIKAEHIIKRRLAAGDVLTRSGDHSFIVWFNTADAKQNEAVLAAAVREIRIRFLTDYGEESTLGIYTSSSSIRPLLPARDH
jgi:CheY-like chemotaxis protein